MNGTPAVSPAIPRKAFPGISRDDLACQEKVLGYFETLSKNTMDEQSICEPTFAATELMLNAVARRDMVWQQLAVLAFNNVDYGSIYSEFDDDLAERLEYIDCGYGSREEYAAFVSGGTDAPDVFLLFMDELTRTLSVSSENYPKRDATYLWSRTERGWKHTRYQVGVPFAEHQKVASKYEDGLLKNDKFRYSLLKQLAFMKRNAESRHLDCARWEFSFPDKRIYTSLSKLIQSGFESQMKDMNGLYISLMNFCLQWHIELLSRDAQMGMCAGVNFLALRVRVSYDSAKQGLDVFIPSYYRFSHLKNYEKQDFAILKFFMDQYASKFEMPKRECKRAELISKARMFRKKLNEQDVGKGKAWDETAKFMGWSPETMKQRLGERPQGKSTLQDDLPDW